MFFKYISSGFQSGNALFRHEVAYVLGQIQSELAKEQLYERLRDTAENDMVRFSTIVEPDKQPSSCNINVSFSFYSLGTP